MGASVVSISSSSAAANFRFTAWYWAQSVARKLGRAWTTWQSGHRPSFANPP